MTGYAYRGSLTPGRDPQDRPAPRQGSPAGGGCLHCPAPATSPGLAACNSHLPAELGITYRQMDYWTRMGWLRPARQGRGQSSGSPRVWPPEEAEVARLMGRLVAAGLPPQRAASIARSGQARTMLAPGIWIEVGPAAGEQGRPAPGAPHGNAARPALSPGRAAPVPAGTGRPDAR